MDDKELIRALIRDTEFIKSIESECGKVKYIYPDFKKNMLIYEFFDGEELYSNLDNILTFLKENNYIAEVLN